MTKVSLTDYIHRWAVIYSLNRVVQGVPFDAFLKAPSIILWSALDVQANRYKRVGFLPLLSQQAAIAARCAP